MPHKYDPLVSEIIMSTSTDRIIEGPITELVDTPHWYKDNICLIGDAAHAMTPNMGQGAGQSIEDAYLLADLLSKHPLKLALKIIKTKEKEELIA